MSVKIAMSNKDEIKLFESLPMAPAVLEQFKTLKSKHGVTLEWGFTAVTFKSGNGNELLTTSLPVGVPIILQKPYTLTPAQRSVCAQVLVKAVNRVTELLDPLDDNGNPKAKSGGKKKAIDLLVEDAQKNQLLQKTTLTKTESGWDVSSPGATPPDPNGIPHLPAAKLALMYSGKAKDEAEAAAPVKLADADHLLQPVHGTSSGSIYYVIGIGHDQPTMEGKPSWALAARLSPDNKVMSVRAEGNMLPDQRNALAECGMVWKSDDYASVHYQLAQVPAARVLGAILYDPRLRLISRLHNVADLFEVSDVHSD